MGRKLKLTAHQRQEALARREADEALVDIARTYNVSDSTISRPGDLHQTSTHQHRPRESLGLLSNETGGDCARSLRYPAELLILVERRFVLASAAKYLEGVNPEQRRAVEHGVGQGCTVGPPLLVIAGAGSGRTNTLAHRVAHLIVNGADLTRILLMTFFAMSRYGDDGLGLWRGYH